MRASQLASSTARRLHGLLNEEREKRGLRPLKGRSGLIDAAERYSRRMAKAGKIGHQVGGKGPSKRAPSRFGGISENVAQVSRSNNPGKVASRLRDQWMNSPGHKKNILRSGSRYDGIGVWVSGNEVYATHLMATSDSLRILSPVTYSVSKVWDYVHIPSSRNHQRLTKLSLFWGTAVLVSALGYLTLVSRFDLFAPSGWRQPFRAFLTLSGVLSGMPMDPVHTTIPPLSAGISGILVASSMGHTKRIDHTITNGLYAAFGLTLLGLTSLLLMVSRGSELAAAMLATVVGYEILLRADTVAKKTNVPIHLVSLAGATVAVSPLMFWYGGETIGALQGLLSTTIPPALVGGAIILLSRRVSID